jgi:hypothetical protein
MAQRSISVNGAPLTMQRLRRAARVGDAAASTITKMVRPARSAGFPYRAPWRRRARRSR